MRNTIFTVLLKINTFANMENIYLIDKFCMLFKIMFEIYNEAIITLFSLDINYLALPLSFKKSCCFNFHITSLK